jgi:hypothetical protein
MNRTFRRVLGRSPAAVREDQSGLRPGICRGESATELTTAAASNNVNAR